MKCHQCNNLAMSAYPAEDGQILLCLDCSLKYDALMNSKMEFIERQINHQLARMELIAGVGPMLPRYPPRPRPVLVGSTTLHHVNISGGNVGVVNTGTIERIDHAVGSLAKGGEPAVAAVLKDLTEAVAKSPDLSDADKKRVLDNLSLVATEAAAPKEARRGPAMLTLIKDTGSVLSAVKTFGDLVEKAIPLLTGLFS